MASKWGYDIVAYFRVQPQNWVGGANEYHEASGLRCLVPLPRFKYNFFVEVIHVCGEISVVIYTETKYYTVSLNNLRVDHPNV